MSQQEQEARREFCNDLVTMKARAGRLQLWRTMHALEHAVTAVGYELADIITGKQHVS